MGVQEEPCQLWAHKLTRMTPRLSLLRDPWGVRFSWVTDTQLRGSAPERNLFPSETSEQSVLEGTLAL